MLFLVMGSMKILFFFTSLILYKSGSTLLFNARSFRNRSVEEGIWLPKRFLVTSLLFCYSWGILKPSNSCFLA